MTKDFKNSETKINLMRAYAGECQALTRYNMAASQAKKSNIPVVGFVFEFTANQEKSHAKVFYDHLKAMAGETVNITGGYPVDISDDLSKLLRYAQHNEYEEYNDVYNSFANKAEEEGFTEIAYSFREISKIENIHGNRFGELANLLEQKKLFVSDVECKWMCLNCGYTVNASEAPLKCPVCKHDQGYFIRFELAPYTKSIN